MTVVKIKPEEDDLLRQVAKAPTGAEKITHKARDLQARGDSDSPAPNLQHRLTRVSMATLPTGRNSVSTALAQC